MRPQIRITSASYSLRGVLDVYIFDKESDRVVPVRLDDDDAQHMVKLPEGQDYPVAMRLNREHAQQLMDDLWNCGIRPVGAAGSVGQLDAVQRHLSDMRQLVSKKLGVELK